MPTDNLGSTRPSTRPLYLASASDADAPLAGNAVRRFQQRASQLPDLFVADVREHLERVLRSPHFDGSARSREFLRYVVEEVLAGRAAYLKQAAIAVDVFGRKPDFDAVIDPIVRVQAGRLRRSLERYYLLSGDAHALRIELPKGSYAPVFLETCEPPESRLNVTETPSTWPTVIVYPFALHSTREDTSANEVREELTAELCRYGIVHVARPGDSNHGELPAALAARFELHGIARDTASESVFAARLVDRSSGQQIW